MKLNRKIEKLKNKSRGTEQKLMALEKWWRIAIIENELSKSNEKKKMEHLKIRDSQLHLIIKNRRKCPFEREPKPIYVCSVINFTGTIDRRKNYYVGCAAWNVPARNTQRNHLSNRVKTVKISLPNLHYTHKTPNLNHYITILYTQKP